MWPVILIDSVVFARSEKSENHAEDKDSEIALQLHGIDGTSPKSASTQLI